MNYNKAIVALILFLINNFANAQSDIPDSTSYQAALQMATDTYKQFIGNEAAIYNGPVFTGFNYTLQAGSQYLIPVQSTHGKVLYNGIMYANVPLMFDVLNNKLITKKPSDNQSFEILNKQVGYFELDQHKFIHLQNTNSKNVPSGFYEIYFEGQKSGIYVLHTKQLREDLEQKFIKYNIEDRSIYFIKKDGTYQKVTKNKDLQRIYAEQQQEIKSFIKKHKLKLSKNTKETLISIANHFETL